MPGLKQRAGGGTRAQKGFHADSRSTDKPAKNSVENSRYDAAQATAGLKRKRSEDNNVEQEKVQATIPAKEDKYTVLATAALATMDAHHPKRWKLETKVASHHDRKAQWLSLSEDEKAARAKEAKASKRAMKKLSEGKAGGKGGEPEGGKGKGSKVDRAVAEAQRGKEMDEMLVQKFKAAGLPSYLTSSEWLSKAQAASLSGAVSEKVALIYRRTYGCQRLGLDAKTGQPVVA